MTDLLWVAALLSLVIWVLGWTSGFLGALIHIFLLLAVLALLSLRLLRLDRLREPHRQASAAATVDTTLEPAGSATGEPASVERANDESPAR